MASVLPLCMLDKANIAAVRQVAPSLVLDGIVPAVGDDDVVVVGDAVVVVGSPAGVRSYTLGELHDRSLLEVASACSRQDSWALILCHVTHS